MKLINFVFLFADEKIKFDFIVISKELILFVFKNIYPKINICADIQKEMIAYMINT